MTNILSEPSSSRQLWVGCFVIALSSFMSGWHTTVLNAAIAKESKGRITADIPMSDIQQELATAAVIAGAFLGSFAGEIPVRRWGYKRTMIWNDVFYVLAAAGCVFSHFSTLIIARFFCGVCVGVTGITAPVLLAETAPAKLRGSCVTLHQLGITIGILFAGIGGYGFVKHMEHGWRWLLLCGAVPPAAQLVLQAWVSESPRWLLRTNKKAAALECLTYLRPSDYDIDGELAEIDADFEIEKLQASVTWAEVFKAKTSLKLGFGLMAAQTFTGINSVMFYSSTVFEIAGVTDALLSTVMMFGLNVFMTVVGLFLIERMGRKWLLLVGTGIMGTALTGLGGVLIFVTASWKGTFAVAMVLLYVTGFAMGLGIVGFVVLGEVVATRIRGKAFSMFMCINWVVNLTLSLTVLSLIEAMGGGSSEGAKQKGVGSLYWIFGGFCIISWIFIFLVIPETKGLSLEQIQEKIHSGSTEHHSSSRKTPEEARLLSAGVAIEDTAAAGFQTL